jgi:muconolactone delta-isomerase
VGLAQRRRVANGVSRHDDNSRSGRKIDALRAHVTQIKDPDGLEVMLRGWLSRPAEQAGEWRTLGLFAADDADQLQQTLASMPLKIWHRSRDPPRAAAPQRPRGSAQMEAIVKALPLDPWMTMELTPLTPHPSDPATTST